MLCRILREICGITVYSKAAGRGTLGNVIKNIMAKAGFEGYYTNHSLRCSCATTLYDNNIPEQVIQDTTGHRSVEGVRAYKCTSSAMKRKMSAVLHGVETPAENGCCDKKVRVCEAVANTGYTPVKSENEKQEDPKTNVEQVFIGTNQMKIVISYK